VIYRSREDERVRGSRRMPGYTIERHRSPDA
jgi:hypothetical protein